MVWTLETYRVCMLSWAPTGISRRLSFPSCQWSQNSISVRGAALSRCSCVPFASMRWLEMWYSEEKWIFHNKTLLMYIIFSASCSWLILISIWNDSHWIYLFSACISQKRRKSNFWLLVKWDTIAAEHSRKDIHTHTHTKEKKKRETKKRRHINNINTGI